VTGALWLLAAFLLGAVPASYIAGRVGGVDLRQHGSKNLGATNVYRVLGWAYAIPVVLFDIAKGVVAVALFGRWAAGPGWLPAALGAGAVLGHVYSPFMGFRGGKGVATGAGAFAALAPFALMLAVPIWALAVWLTGYVSVGSILAALSVPVWVGVTRPGDRLTLYAGVGVALLIVYTHRGNVRRLLAGTEQRFRTRKVGTT
jgi:glycerol-3-phosphate acyltransferase PlsY